MGTKVTTTAKGSIFLSNAGLAVNVYIQDYFFVNFI